MDRTQQSRAFYRPSGHVNWLKFLPGLLASAGVAIAMAWCLFWALQRGFYLIFFAPLIAALPVAGLWYLVLTWSHCRNKGIAAVISVILGSVLYLGYYEIGLLDVVGARNVHRIDLLPRYVQFRMKTDGARDARHPIAGRAARQGPNRVQQALNWFSFGGELIMVIGVLVSVGQYCTTRAYCEPCSQWMKSETLKLPPASGVPLWESLQRGENVGVHERLTSTSRQSAIGCTLTVDHCPACAAEQRSQAMYLTVKDVPTPGMHDPLSAKVASLFKPRPSAGLRTLVDHVALQPAEIGALAASFPGLKSTIETHPNLCAQAHSTSREIEQAFEAPEGQRTRRVARIEAVEPSDAGKVLTRWNAIIQTLIAIVTIFGGFGLAFGPAGVLFALQPKPPDWVFGVATGWLILCLALNLVWILLFPGYMTARFMRRQTMEAFEYRPNPAVDLNDPELVFVDIVPRIHWGKAMMESASDIGFLQLNKAKRQLIFEGDRERYWIPVESILEIKHEFWAESVQHQLQSSPTLNHLIVVRAQTVDGPWETWFSRRQSKFRMRTAKSRLADAEELESKIRELMGPPN